MACRIKTHNRKLLQQCMFGCVVLFMVLLFPNHVKSQARDISKISSGGKLNPLQAIMDIRHYTINLNVDIEQQSIKGNVEIRLILSKQTDTLLLDLLDEMLVTKCAFSADNKNKSKQ